MSNINSADATPNPPKADAPYLSIEVEQFAPPPIRRHTHAHHREEEEKENRKEVANSHVGRIVRKNNSFLRKKNTQTKAIDHLNCTSKSHTSTTPHHHNTQLTENPHPSQLKQYNILQKQVVTMRRSMERSERSKSAASEQLSASKSTIRSLKKQEKKQQGAMNKLKRELKKSEAIREKQKLVIAAQQKQIGSLLKQLSQMNKLR